ncbi:hypothetical protein TNCV_2823171 [Trichonephila clavipes]|nr:hypothetical protein TNCV_2823171 [Trichonephila clavipes]
MCFSWSLKYLVSATAVLWFGEKLRRIARPVAYQTRKSVLEEILEIQVRLSRRATVIEFLKKDDNTLTQKI